jgi:hypothetical protein
MEECSQAVKTSSLGQQLGAYDPLTEKAAPRSSRSINTHNGNRRVDFPHNRGYAKSGANSARRRPGLSSIIPAVARYRQSLPEIGIILKANNREPLILLL